MIITYFFKTYFSTVLTKYILIRYRGIPVKNYINRIMVLALLISNIWEQLQQIKTPRMKKTKNRLISTNIRSRLPFLHVFFLKTIKSKYTEL